MLKTLKKAKETLLVKVCMKQQQSTDDKETKKPFRLGFETL